MIKEETEDILMEQQQKKYLHIQALTIRVHAYVTYTRS